ncbi:MAG: tetratricopeptide repeat protein [Pseudomonadota bacterium]
MPTFLTRSRLSRAANFVALLLTSVLATGCVYISESSETESAGHSSGHGAAAAGPTLDDPVVDSAEKAKDAEEPKGGSMVAENEDEAPIDALVIERAIPETSVYPLLVAEFAIRRRDFNRALQIYLQQAELLREAAVSAHATHLAQFLRREADAFRAVSLWVELEPDNVEANNTLATLLARQGRTLEALPYLAQVARGGEAAKFPLLLNQYKALPEADQRALDVQVQALLDEDLGGNVSLLLTHALMAEEAGDTNEALDRLGPVFELEPYQEQALILEAKVKSANKDDDALARIEEALELDPSRAQLRLQYARLLATKDMNAAREQFEILSAQAPQNSDLLFSLAVLNNELGDTVSAKAYLRKVLALNRRQDEAYYLLGQIAASEGKFEDAVRLYQQVGDGKDLMRATVSIAQILLAAGRDGDLANYMNRLRDSYPPRREQLYSLEANLYSEARKDDAGLNVLNRAITEFPESESLLYARSVVYERRNNIDGAESDLRVIIGKNPDNATALNALGYTLANRTDRYEEARSLIEKALELSPNEPAILDSMGWVLYHQGDLLESLDYLRKAYEQFPDPEVAAHLGEVMWVSGDRGSAMTVWREAIAKNPEHGVLTSTLDRLGITLTADAEADAGEVDTGTE